MGTETVTLLVLGIAVALWLALWFVALPACEILGGIRGRTAPISARPAPPAPVRRGLGGER